MNGIDWQTVEGEAVGYLQALLRIDTTNPPGNEQAAAEYLADILAREGLAPSVLSSAPGRSSVVARLPGRGERGPLLLQGHTDVVPADPSEWSVLPFSGAIQDGCVWGRGALDMKGTIVMQLMAVLLAKRTGLRPAGDIIFAAVADEEMGGRMGAGFLVDEHPELVRAEYALGEVGGFSLYIGNAVFYPIQVTEKDGCSLTITARGASGHGSQPIRDGAMAIAGRVLERLTSQRLPLHVLPIVERFIRAIAQEQPELLGLLDTQRAANVLAEMGADGRMYEAITHNTAVPTVIQGGSKSNVIPGSVTITVDGRTLPGQSAEEFVNEVRDVLQDELAHLTIEPRTWSGQSASLGGRPPVYEAPTDAFFDKLGAIVEELEPGARPVPYLVSGGTDARHFARLGTRCYGFAPVRLRRDMAFWTLFHSADERIPLDGLRFGLQAVYRAVEIY
jgi:acetylornithine deacetylase/succinyl-diaminopimelate desuccinylase-like protein